MQCIPSPAFSPAVAIFYSAVTDGAFFVQERERKAQRIAEEARRKEAERQAKLCACCRKYPHGSMLLEQGRDSVHELTEFELEKKKSAEIKPDVVTATSLPFADERLKFRRSDNIS